MTISAKKNNLKNSIKNSQTFKPKNGQILFSEFKKDEHHSFYEDDIDENRRHSKGSLNSMEKVKSINETEPSEKNEPSEPNEPNESNELDRTDSPKQTNYFMQDDDIRDYTDNEKQFLIVLSNTSLVYDYSLSDEYMLTLLKHNGMTAIIDEYMSLIAQNNLNYRH
jgi:hypothetical protein